MNTTELTACMTNPTRCIADAHFYATMTGQWENARLIEEATFEMLDIFDQLEAEGVLTLHENGLGSAEMQTLMEQHAHDPRIAKILDLAKTRFIISIADHDTNTQMNAKLINDGFLGNETPINQSAAGSASRVLN